jgi:hypothetical protein
MLSLSISHFDPLQTFDTAFIRDGSSELSSRCDTVKCGPVDDRNLPIRVDHVSDQSGSCPILAVLLIEVAAGTLDGSVVGLSPLPEQV